MDDFQHSAQMPRTFVAAVVCVTVSPLVLHLTGVDFGMPDEATGTTQAAVGPLLGNVKGAVVQSIMEWTACCVALFTAVLAFAHYHIKRDPTSPVLGTALFCAAMLNAFRILYCDGLLGPVADPGRFVPLTWTISQAFYVLVLILGTAPFAFRELAGTLKPVHHSWRILLPGGLLMMGMAWAIMKICAEIPQLPESVHPEATVSRPWDSMTLVLYLIAGGFVFSRFHRRQRNLFSYALVLSVVPHAAAQFHAALGSRGPYDSHLHIAHFLKIVAYLVPLAGLIFDYARAYRLEVKLRTTEEKLRVAREIQQRLLPASAPDFAGFELAGVSESADAVGGDFFDFVPLSDDRLAVVVADVSGHEIGTALLMAETRAFVRALASSEDDPAQMTQRLNQFLKTDIRDRWFVTMFYAELLSDRGEFRYVAAGHPAYIVRGDGAVEQLSTTSPPLGITEHTAGADARLERGDVLLIPTDGVLEFRSPSGQQFGSQRAAAAVHRVRSEPPEKLVQAVVEDFAAYRRNAPAGDDTTVVVVKRT